MKSINWTEVLISTIAGLVLAGLSYGIGIAFSWLQPSDFSQIEFWGVVFNYICVILTARQNIIAWPTGIVAVVFLGILFWNLQLYSSLILTIGYFLPVQFYGWYKWVYGGRGTLQLPVSTLKFEGYLMLFIAVPALVYGIGYLNGMFGGASPILDTMILVVSICAQQLLAIKKIESWVLWAVVNIVSLYVYTKAGAFLLGFQYTLFLFNAFYGFYKWKTDKFDDTFANFFKEEPKAQGGNATDPDDVWNPVGDLGESVKK